MYFAHLEIGNAHLQMRMRICKCILRIYKSQTDFCDASHLGAQLFLRVREPASWYFIWSAPPHSGRPFSTFRAPAARRILCAYGTQYYYGRGSGPWVCVLLGSELASLIPQLFWDQV